MRLLLIFAAGRERSKGRDCPPTLAGGEPQHRRPVGEAESQQRRSPADPRELVHASRQHPPAAPGHRDATLVDDDRARAKQRERGDSSDQSTCEPVEPPQLTAEPVSSARPASHDPPAAIIAAVVNRSGRSDTRMRCTPRAYASLWTARRPSCSIACADAAHPVRPRQTGADAGRSRVGRNAPPVLQRSQVQALLRSPA